MFVTEFVPLLAILLIPASVHAGVFSSIANLWSEEVVAQEVTEVMNHSASYTPLLSATLNPDPQKAIGGGDVSFENGALISTGPVGADEIAAAGNDGEISVYVVREGDALSQIAEMYGVTTNTILWANDLSSAAGIQPGDTLVILPFVGVRHEVASGETLGSILKKYDANKEEVLNYNNLASADSLSVGDELMIPGGEMHTAPTRVVYAAPTKSSGSTGGGGLTHPAPGAVKTQGIHGYNSVDLAAGYGSAIRAAAAGEVIISKSNGWNGGYGQYIVIRHNNGTQTLYAHLSSNNVGAGAYVSAGQVIGGMGSTGKSTGTHLHFEVRGGRNPF
jgi:LysM repeat protein